MWGRPPGRPRASLSTAGVQRVRPGPPRASLSTAGPQRVQHGPPRASLSTAGPQRVRPAPYFCFATICSFTLSYTPCGRIPFCASSSFRL